jgi:tripartite-type tricarboxylate transporter receptor subunit TctC
MSRGLVAVLAVAAALCGPPPAHAQTYPDKPIRVIVNSAPGGLTDVVARLVTTRMSQSLGQPLVIDNRTGSGGMVGAELVAKAEPNGYTIAVVGAAITAAPSLTPGLSFDPLKDFTPVCLLVSTPLLLVTNTASPYRTLAQYVADAKAKPGQISIASGGNGTIGHLLAEQLQVDAGLKLIHVPYKGGAPALNDVIAGHVPVFFDTLTTSAKLVQEDKLRALGIVSAKRSPALPNVPTFAELGHADISGSTWFAIIAPAGTPREIVTKLNEEANKALSLPDIRERIASLGGTVEGGPPSVLADLMRSEVPKWSKLIRERGITAQ